MITKEYLEAHMSDNAAHYAEAGKLLSNAIMQDAIEHVKQNGGVEKIVLTPTIELTENIAAGCVTVTYTRHDGTTLSFHRPT